MFTLAKFRYFIWRILGVNYFEIKRLNDVVSLQNDKFTTLGRGTYHNGAYVSRTGKTELKIGNYTSIAKGVWFVLDDNLHQMSEVTNSPLAAKYSFDYTAINKRKWEGITIGNDVWLGMNCIIMPDVTIGNGAIIGANSVVTKDIPPFSIAVGSPARVVKRKYNDDIIFKLEKIAWWNWEEDIIEKKCQRFLFRCRLLCK